MHSYRISLLNQNIGKQKTIREYSKLTESIYYACSLYKSIWKVAGGTVRGRVSSNGIRRDTRNRNVKIVANQAIVKRLCGIIQARLEKRSYLWKDEFNRNPFCRAPIFRGSRFDRKCLDRFCAWPAECNADGRELATPLGLNLGLTYISASPVLPYRRGQPAGIFLGHAVAVPVPGNRRKDKGAAGARAIHHPRSAGVETHSAIVWRGGIACARAFSSEVAVGRYIYARRFLFHDFSRWIRRRRPKTRIECIAVFPLV